jgi:hypothetical protein
MFVKNPMPMNRWALVVGGISALYIVNGVREYNEGTRTIDRIRQESPLTKSIFEMRDACSYAKSAWCVDVKEKVFGATVAARDSAFDRLPDYDLADDQMSWGSGKAILGSAVALNVLLWTLVPAYANFRNKKEK